MKALILSLDQDESQNTALIEQLEYVYDVSRTTIIETFNQKLIEESFHLILIHTRRNPHVDLDLIKTIKNDPMLKWIPILVTMDKNSIHLKSIFFENGANLCLEGSIQWDDLYLNIENLLKQAKNLELMAFRDTLVNDVYNRRYFDHCIKAEAQRAERNSTPVSLVFIDADRFKNINDTYGHHTGDMVLIGLARMLKSQLRQTDILARYGGEEFVIVLPNTKLKDGFNKINGILSFVRSNPVAEHEGKDIFITFSAGISEWDNNTMSIESWIKYSDDAAYDAKKRGRDQVVLSNATENNQEPVVILKKNVLLYNSTNLHDFLATIDLPIDVRTVHHSNEIMEQVLSNEINLCIFDAAVPNIYEIIKEIKINSRYGNKIKFLVHSKQKDDLLHCLQLGVDHFLFKDFTHIEFEMQIIRLLGIEIQK